MKTVKSHTKMVPPDGGWGWLIVLGSSLINISTVSIGPSFGLLFGGLLKQLGVETTGASLVLSTFDGLANFLGLIVGPLIKKYTYRKVAISGAVVSAAAFLLTAPANSIIHIILTFGLLGGIGCGLTGSSALVAINAYFSKKKGQAVGLAMAGTVVGHMLMPQVVRILLDEYDFRSALLIIGAISLHAFVGACLFQPVSWHMKTVVADIEEGHTLLPLDKVENKSSSASVDTTDCIRSIESQLTFEGRKDLSNTTPLEGREPLISSFYFLGDGAGTFNIQGSTKEGSEKELEKMIVNPNLKETHKDNLTNKPPKNSYQVLKKRFLRFIEFMDLDLLRDGVYLNILFEQAVLVVVEINFRLILPFHLLDLGLTHSETASVLSTMAVSDICSRLIIPPILDRLTFSRRASFMFGSICVALGRSCLALQRTIGRILIASLIIGFFRGISLTSFPLVLTEYKTKKNFASVLGLSMVFRGISVTVFGPLSGYLRDVINSYPLFIHAQTALVISALIAWIVEIIILKHKNKKQTILDDASTENEDKLHKN